MTLWSQDRLWHRGQHGHQGERARDGRQRGCVRISMGVCREPPWDLTGRRPRPEIAPRRSPPPLSRGSDPLLAPGKGMNPPLGSCGTEIGVCGATKQPDGVWSRRLGGADRTHPHPCTITAWPAQATQPHCGVCWALPAKLWADRRGDTVEAVWTAARPCGPSVRCDPGTLSLNLHCTDEETEAWGSDRVWSPSGAVAQAGFKPGQRPPDHPSQHCCLVALETFEDSATACASHAAPGRHHALPRS